MARPTKTRAPEKTDGIAAANINHKALREAGDAAAMHGQKLEVIDMRFALDGEYDLSNIESMLPAAMAMSATAALWIGRALILVKEHEAKGTFGAFLERHGFIPRSARRYMSLAARFGKNDQRRLLAGKLGMGKAMELLGESDEELDAIADDEENPIFSMSRTEIRALINKKEKALAKLEGKLEATEELLADKNKKIDDLVRAASGREDTSLMDDAKLKLAIIDRITVDINAGIIELQRTAEQAEAIFEDAGEPIDPLITDRIDGARASIANWLNTIAAALGE